MAKMLITDLDLSQNQLLNVVVQKIATSSMSTPVEGQMWYDTNTKQMWYYDGNASKEVLHVSPDADSIGAVKIADSVVANDSRVWSDHTVVSPKAVNDVRALINQDIDDLASEIDTINNTTIPNVSSSLNAQIVTEANTRSSADVQIQSNLDSSVSALNTSIANTSSALHLEVTSEASIRSNADDVITSNVATVSSALTTKINDVEDSLTSAITNEATTRENWDYILDSKLLNSKTRVLDIKDYDFTAEKQNIKNRPVVAGNKLIKAITDIIKEHAIFDIDPSTQEPTPKGNVLGMEYPIILKAGDFKFACTEILESANPEVKAIVCVGLDINQTDLFAAIQEYTSTGNKDKIDAIIPNLQRLVFLYDGNSQNTYTFFSETINISQFTNDVHYAVENKLLYLSDYDYNGEIADINNQVVSNSLISDIIATISADKRNIYLVGGSNKVSTFSVVNYSTENSSTGNKYVSCVKLGLDVDASGSVTEQIPHMEKLVFYFNASANEGAGETRAYYSNTEKLEHFDNTTTDATKKLTTKDYVDTQIAQSLIGALKYKGTVDLTNATSYDDVLASQLPIAQGAMYYVKCDPKKTISGVEWSTGDYLVFLANVSTTPIPAEAIEKIDNTEKDDIIRMSQYRGEGSEQRKQVDNLFLTNTLIDCADGDYTKNQVLHLPESSFDTNLSGDYLNQVARKFRAVNSALTHDSATNTVTWYVICSSSVGQPTAPANASYFVRPKKYSAEDYPTVGQDAIIKIYKKTATNVYEEVITDVTFYYNSTELTGTSQNYFKIVMNSSVDISASTFKAVVIG